MAIVINNIYDEYVIMVVKVVATSLGNDEVKKADAVMENKN